MTDRPSEDISLDESRAAFTEFVRAVTTTHLWPMAQKYVAFSSLPRDRAPEILQETLSRTWRRWPTHLRHYDTEHRLASVFTTMLNVVREETRHYRTSQHKDLSVVDDLMASDDVEDRALGRIALRAVQDGLARLDDDERRLIELSAAGLASAVIGEQLGLTATNVRTRLKRARDRLHQLIDSTELCAVPLAGDVA